MTPTAEAACTVCDKAAQESNSTVCGCDRRFHLNLCNDVNGKDCGDVWIDEQYLSLRFAYINCLRPDGRPSGLRHPAASGEEVEPPVGEGH